MATALHKPAPSVSVPEPDGEPTYHLFPSRRRPWVKWLVWTMILAIGSLGMAAVLRSNFMSSGSADHSYLTQKVRRADLLVTVTEDGNLESASNVDVKCEVAGGSTILWLIEDGKHVNKGDELVRLDSSAIEDQISQQKIAYEKAQAARIQAEKEFSAAKIAVQEYVEGTFLKEVQDVASQITVALENLRSAENSLQHTERMARKGYVTSLQRDAQAFAVERAKLDLASARTAKRVLEKFTRAKMVEELESKRDSAEARMRSEHAAFELEDARLKRLTLQLEKCVIKAPRDGMVVYANEASGRWGQQTASIEEGALVRERQAIIRLPNLADMQVKASVHESKVESLRPGMPARIRIQGKDYDGSVTSVANQAEAASWFSANVKEYATLVKIHGESSEWKPGMTAVVEILIAHLKNVLSVPLQAVVDVGGRNYCFVRTGDRIEHRQVKLGYENNTAVEVTSGLEEGDTVLLNARRYIGTLPDELKQAATKPVEKAFAPPEAPGDAAGKESPPDTGAVPPAAGPSATATTSPSSTDGAPSPAPKRGAFDPLQFDKNGDRRISRDEAPEQMQQFFDTADGNHDGYIDLKEIAAMRRHFQQAGGAPAANP